MTHRHAVAVMELHAGSCQRIDMRRWPTFAAVGSDWLNTNIVGKNQKNIGELIGRIAVSGKYTGQNEANRQSNFHEQVFFHHCMSALLNAKREFRRTTDQCDKLWKSKDTVSESSCAASCLLRFLPGPVRKSCQFHDRCLGSVQHSCSSFG